MERPPHQRFSQRNVALNLLRCFFSCEAANGWNKTLCLLLRILLLVELIRLEMMAERVCALSHKKDMPVWTALITSPHSAAQYINPPVFLSLAHAPAFKVCLHCQRELSIHIILLLLCSDKWGIMYALLHRFPQMFVGLFEASKHDKLVPGEHIVSFYRDYKGSAYHEGHRTV